MTFLKIFFRANFTSVHHEPIRTLRYTILFGMMSASMTFHTLSSTIMGNDVPLHKRFKINQNLIALICAYNSNQDLGGLHCIKFNEHFRLANHREFHAFDPFVLRLIRVDGNYLLLVPHSQGPRVDGY